MVNQEHLTMKGLTKIVNLKASMNFGTMPKSIISLFPAINPIKRPVRESFSIYHPYWVVGYIEGEGMFFINIYKRKDTVLGEGVKLVFKITQDRRNLALLESFINIFTVGKVYQQSPTVKVMDFMITGLADITKYVIPFFHVHPLEGAKKDDFYDFVKVAELMKSKAHLNKNGLEQIRSIKLGMNSNRN
jgi:LAGLIDADG endonuclease